ncbi:ATP-binding cassette domain-containing protein [Thioclava electrotropha]|nr:ATP-binding cassette domain-containing protein [Thioclava electrotropha]
MTQSSPAPAAAHLRNVSKFYGTFQALREVSLDIPPGKVTCLIGPSGSGKSTLLRCINFLEEYDSGEVRIDDQLIGYETPGGKRWPHGNCEKCDATSAWCSSSSISGRT